jgi:hypothetical protein
MLPLYIYCCTLVDTSGEVSISSKVKMSEEFVGKGELDSDNIADDLTEASSIGGFGMSKLKGQVAATADDAVGNLKASARRAGLGLGEALGKVVSEEAERFSESMRNGKGENQYQGAAERYYSKMAVSGGGGCGCDAPTGAGITGAADLEDYSEGIYSITKDNLIHDIADAMRGLGLKVEGNSRDDLVNSMMQAVPNTRKNRKTFKADVKVHKEICSKIAEVLNQKFGAKLIDPKAAPEIVCQSAAELIYSLHTGMHSEFLAVHGDVAQIVRNLAILRNALSDNMKQLEQKLDSIKDGKAKLKVGKNIALHKDTLTEIDRQHAMLNSFLSISLSPADVELEKLVSKGKEIDILGLIQPLKKQDIPHRPGSKAFSNTISRVLQGLALTPAYAAVIDKALKKAGMSIKEYAGMERLSELMDRISSELAKDQSDESLHELIQAMELLVKNFYRNKDIASILNKSGSGEYGMSAVEGGLGRGLGKHIKDKETTRKALFYSFSKQTNAAFDRILASVEVLAKNLGTEDVPMTDQLDGFRESFAQLGDIRRRQTYFALTGYYNDAVSKEMRERYLGKLRMLQSYAESLSEMSVYGKVADQFKDIKGAVAALIETVDRYADIVSAKFGSGEYEAEVDGGAKMSETFEQGMDVHKSTSTIGKAVTMFDYYFRVAQIRRNLREASQDMDKYGENYQELLAATIGEKVQRIEDGYTDDLKKLNSKDLHPRLNYSGKANSSEGIHDDVNNKKGTQLKENIKKYLKAQKNARVKFWETVEAVDHYLKEFTNGIMKHPDDIKDIKGTLDGVQVISNWYSDRSGNELAYLFEHFPSEVRGVDTAAHNVQDGNPNNVDIYRPNYFKEHMGASNVKSGERHYYSVARSVFEVSNLNGVAGTTGPNARNARPMDALPGNPFLVQTPNDADSIRKQAMVSIANMALLKNLMSVFVRIGDRLGGESIHKKTFMSPMEMYDNICEYLVASSLGHGGIGRGANTSATGKLGFNLATWDKGAVVAGRHADNSHNAPNVAVGTYDINDQNDQVITLGVSPHSIATGPEQTFYGIETSIIRGPDLILLQDVLADVNWEPTGDLRTVAVGDGQDEEDLDKQHLADYIRELKNAVPALGELIDSLVRNRPNRNARWFHNVFVNYRTGVNPALPNALTPILKGTAAGSTNLNVAVNRRMADLAVLRDWGLYMRGVGELADDFNGNFDCGEDAMFVDMLKALSAKVLTVLGTYDLMERPNERQLINPVRMILGGDDELPEISEEVVELYVRLPLLADFYRQLFDFEGKTTNGNYANTQSDTLKITMLPEIEGKFAQVVRLLFRRYAHVKNQQYTDSELAELIREINTLYNHYRGKDDASHQLIRDFMNEVNKRYGFLKYKDHVEYLKHIQSQDLYGRHDLNFNRSRDYEEDNDNYSILPGEDDMSTERVAPSAAYVTKKSSEITSKAIKSAVAEQHNLMKKFRCRVDNFFTKGMDGDNVCPSDADDSTLDYNDPKNIRETGSFRFSIKRTQMQLRQLKDKKERYQMVSRLMRGHDATSSSDHIKHVIFHETVVSGLNALSGIHSILERFQREVLLSDVADVEQFLEVIFKGDNSKIENMNIQGVNPILHPATLTRNGVRNQVRQYLENKYKHRFGNLQAIYDSAADSLIRDDVSLGNVGDRSGLIGAAASIGSIQRSNTNNGWDGTNIGAGQSEGLLSILGYDENANAGDADNIPGPKAINTAIRYIIKRESIMKRLLEVIFGISDDLQGLVTVDVGESIQINFGGVRDLVEKLIGDVKHFMEKLRPFIPPEVMYPYEKKENPGSIYWLEEHLMEKLFVGRESVDAKTLESGSGLSAQTGYVSLNDTVRVLNNTYQRLTCSWNVDGMDVNFAAAGNLSLVHDATDITKKDHYDREVCALAYYSHELNSAVSRHIDATNPAAPQADGRAEGSILELLLRPATNGALTKTTGAHDWYVDDLHNDGTEIKMEPGVNNSIMFAFNRILENYLAVFVDRVSNRVYRGVIENLANGVLSGVVANPDKAWPDFLMGPYDDPKSTSVAFNSLAVVMRTLVEAKDRTEKKYRYIEESLSEISLYMKEKYRTFMPIYKTMLRELIKKAELLRKLILHNGGNKLSMIRDIDIISSGAAAAAGEMQMSSAQHNGDVLKQITAYNSLNTHTAEVLAAVIEASMGLMGCIDQVLRELGDEPRYMETRMNSLADFKSINNREPLTPLSNLMYVMRTGNQLLQLEASQGPEFKLQYGTRAVLARPDIELQPEHMPHVNQLYDMYNSSVDGREQLDMNRVGDFNKRLISSMRWIHETKNIKNLLAAVDNTVGNAGGGNYNTPLPTAYLLHDVKNNPTQLNHIEGKADNATAAQADTKEHLNDQFDHGNWRLTASISTHADNKIKAVYAINQANATALVDITENSLRKEKLEDLSKYIHNKSTKRDLVMQNILDMNVVPINIHAFMREMPMANIYNYSYTFERLIVELFYGLDEPYIRAEMLKVLCDDDDKRTKLQGLIRNSKDLFVALLIDPYLELTKNGLYELMRALFRGNSSMELDRPKYLGDQVFNKVLFDQLYEQSVNAVQMGPHAEGATHLDMHNQPVIGRVNAARALVPANPDPDVTAAANAPEDLTYLPSNQNVVSRANYQAVQNVNVENIVAMLRATGLLRFDTRLVRNLIFLVNLYRVIRLKLRKDLMYDRNVILKSHSIAREDNTEHIRNDRWTPRNYPPGSRMAQRNEPRAAGI